MTIPAADDVAAIRRSFAARVDGSIRDVPPGCVDRSGWLDGWDEAHRLKPAEE